MKLRLETGNFTITETYDGASDSTIYESLPKGLKPIDFIGSVICYCDAGFDCFSTVANARTDDEYPHVVDFQYLEGNLAALLYYNSLNGKVGVSVDAVLDTDSSGGGAVVH